jgi:phosphoribosylaminoimidazole carboxylase
LATISDVLTVETQHVNTSALEELERAGSIVHPAAETIRTLSDKFLQKEFLGRLHLPHTDYVALDGTTEDLQNAADALGFPFLVKRRDLGFNGAGNMLIKDESMFDSCLDWMSGCDIFAERVCDFEKELSVLFVVSANGSNVTNYPIVESIVAEEGQSRMVIAPAQIHTSVESECLTLAKTALAALKGHGVYCVEFFMMRDETLFINEITPRYVHR